MQARGSSPPVFGMASALQSAPETLGMPDSNEEYEEDLKSNGEEVDLPGFVWE